MTRHGAFQRSLGTGAHVARIVEEGPGQRGFRNTTRMSVAGSTVEPGREKSMSERKTAAVPEVPFAAPRLSSEKEHLVRAADHLWRVQDTREHVLGHLRIVPDPLGIRYRAERLHLATGRFRLIGEFWRADDAVAALRHC